VRLARPCRHICVGVARLGRLHRRRRRGGGTPQGLIRKSSHEAGVVEVQRCRAECQVAQALRVEGGELVRWGDGGGR